MDIIHPEMDMLNNINDNQEKLNRRKEPPSTSRQGEGKVSPHAVSEKNSEYARADPAKG